MSEQEKRKFTIEEQEKLSVLTGEGDAEFRKLLQENPTMPIVFFVESGNSGEGKRITKIGGEIVEILDCDQEVDKGCLFIGRESLADDIMEHIYDAHASGNTDSRWYGVDASQALKEYEPYWRKCIFVHVNI